MDTHTLCRSLTGCIEVITRGRDAAVLSVTEASREGDSGGREGERMKVRERENTDEGQERGRKNGEGMIGQDGR